MQQKEAFLDAFDTYSDALYRHAYFRLGGDREQALDCVQDTYMRVWEAIMRETEIRNWQAFLYRTLHNRIIDQYRRKKTYSLDRLQEDAEGGGFDPEDEHAIMQFDRICTKDEITRAFVHLSGTYKEVVVLRYIDELSPKEIAEILQEEENAVSVRIHRGLRKLADILKHYEQQS